jgi:hypothetical protein
LVNKRANQPTNKPFPKSRFLLEVEAMNNIQNVLNTVTEIVQSDEFEQFQVNARDFLSAREQGQSPGTKISQMTASMGEAAEILNRSFAKTESDGRYTNVISPVVIPKETRSFLWLVWAFLGLLFGLLGSSLSSGLDSLIGTRASLVFFGPHYWLVWLAYVGFSVWRNSFVEIPDGCQALITKFGKVESVVGAGRTRLLDPRRKVSYIVNTTKEYPYNAPIRQAPTSGRIDASVDLFLQFKIEEPSEFIFTLGGVNGFSEKLHNAISEVTRALIYEQKAEEIYDLVGESTQGLLKTLNNQFQPAVKFVNANITHAEPASQEYRMDLAAAEIVRVAKEAYNYQYELKLRKEQDEGELNKELATLKETLSEIKADIARYQAQITVAREKEINRANAYARQLMVEAESEAKANAALLDAQALDIRAISSAYYPEILQYRYQQDVLAKLEAVADNLPQMINVGDGDSRIDYMAIAQQMMGIEDTTLFSDADIQAIRKRMKAIVARIRERAAEIDEVVAGENGRSAQEVALAVSPDEVLQELDNEAGQQAEEVK